MKDELILISRLTIEAETPICISAGSDDTISHAIVVRDVNRLPYIPASTIKGVIYKELGVVKNRLNGEKRPDLSFTDALMTDERCIVVDGRRDYNIFNLKNDQKTIDNSYFGYFERLPIRYHATTNEKGSSSFDIKGVNNEQVIYKGTRFVFEMEMRCGEKSDSDEQIFYHIIQLLMHSPVRFGRGSRRGLGKIKLVKCLTAEVHMKNDEERNAYLMKSGRLDEGFSLFKEYLHKADDTLKEGSAWRTYRLSLKPRDFFIFGASAEDGNINYPSAIESYIEWGTYINRNIKYEGASFKKGYLIPASAIKGALLHRTKYHYCKMKGIFEDNNADFDVVNTAVCCLFGGKKDKSSRFQKGNVIFSDIIIPENYMEKDIVFYNIGIDRLTGKQFERVLYSQKVTRLKDSIPGDSINIEFFVKEETVDKEVIEAFRQGVNDICEGRLPLGRGSGLGMGFFKGKFEIE